MNNRISLREITDRLSEHRISHSVVPIGGEIVIVVTALGGRIFGPFIPGLEFGLTWTHSAFSSPDSFEQLLKDREWNLGGDRVWVGPGVQFALHERPDEPDGGGYDVPPAMDPGYFSLAQIGQDTWRLSQAMTLEAHHLATGLKTMRLERTIRPLRNPLSGVARLDALMEDVLYAGYEQEIALSEARADDIMAAWWSLTSLHPGGEYLLAVNPGVEYDDYLAPAPPDALHISGRQVRARIGGDLTYYTGFRAPYVSGRCAYLNTLGAGYSYLMIRAFFSDPSGDYLEEPPHLPGQNGACAFVSSLGDSGEMACQGSAIGGDSGRSNVVDRIPMWLFVGQAARIKAIGQILLGIEV